MKVHTYFSPSRNSPIHEDLRMIFLWMENWRAAGFTPIVLNDYAVMNSGAVETVPAIDAACAASATLLTEFTVFNFGWKPGNWKKKAPFEPVDFLEEGWQSASLVRFKTWQQVVDLKRAI